MKFKLLTSICFSIVLLKAAAQFAPPAGQPGSTAIFKDSSAFSSWATGCTVIRGLQDISDPGLGYASAGDSTMTLGTAGANGVVSLGDGGTATLTFAYPVINGGGYDFAVFENSFNDFFLELAFVEVSSDGINYFRFHSTSLSDTTAQIEFDPVDATKINNLAGKYRALYGTPFDLEELKNETGLNVNNITHIRIIDAVGCIQNGYARYDYNGNKINDPWSTPFPSGGFDLDAVGVINSTVSGIGEINAYHFINVFPNPVKQNESIYLSIDHSLNKDLTIRLFDVSGRLLKEQVISPDASNFSISSGELKAGIYWLSIRSGSFSSDKKIVIFSN